MSNKIIGRLVRHEGETSAFLTYYADSKGVKRLTIFSVDEVDGSNFNSGTTMQVFLSRLLRAKTGDPIGSYVADNLKQEVYDTE